MAYFDNPERRAAWEKELSALRQEKEARKGGMSVRKPSPSEMYASAEATADKAPLRERISYIELLQEENMKSAAVSKTASERELQKEVQLEK